MTVTISRLFDNYSAALQAVRDLETAGVPQAEISIVASNADGWYATEHGTSAPARGLRQTVWTETRTALTIALRDAAKAPG